MPSLLAGAGLNWLAGPPSLPCWWEARQAQPVCPPRRPVPSGPAQTARGAGRGLPAWFSFRASPGCSPDIPEGTCRRRSRPWLGKPGLQAASWSESAPMFSLPCRHFKSCLTPQGVWATVSGALTLAFETPVARNTRASAEQARLPWAPTCLCIGPPLGLCAQPGLRLADGLTSSRESRGFLVEGALNNTMPLMLCQLLAEVRSPPPPRKEQVGPL